MKKIILSLSFLIAGLNSFGQTKELEHFCGTSERMIEMSQDPQMAQQLILDEQIRQQEALNPNFVQKATVLKIPVVFHVLHNGGTENVSEEQIYNALEVITRDFRKQNADTSDVISEFKSIAADADIEFVLATKAPDGTCFRGYTRTQSPLTFDGSDGGAQVEAIRDGNDIYQGNWPSNKYLNVFVVAHANGAGGYTRYPSNNNYGNMYNGIWILHNQFGEIGTSSLSAGRSLTHECGHWLNLKHTWGGTNSPGPGENNCNSDDDVTDTPYCEGVSSGCPLTQETCGSLDNVQNYMDYALPCQKMYTVGQVDRMRIALQSSIGGRNNLWTTANLNETGANGVPTLCKAEFTVNRTSICAGESLQFTDDTFNAVNGWTWTFDGGTPATSTSQDPMITYMNPGLYTVTLVATDGATSETETKTNYIRVLPAPTSTPILEGFESYSTLSDIEQWEIVNDQGNKWELTSTTGLNSTKSARIINHGQPTGNIDELVAAPVDLSNVSTEVTLSFRYAYKRRDISDDDWLRVYASKDCGDSWVIRKTLHGGFLTSEIQSSSFVPTSENDWTTVHITNISSAYWVENFRYKFQFKSGGGNNMYIDNINIYEGGPSDDVVGGTAELSELEALNSLVLYPNPVQNDVNVKFNADSATDAYFTIQDVTGKIAQKHLIKAQSGSNLVQFDTVGMAAGIYFIEVEITGAKRTLQFIVK